MYVVITGASRGIGKALAIEYASHKYNLVLTCRNNIDLLNELKVEITNKHGVDVIIHKGNIYDEPFNEKIEKIKSEIYILINNQGIANYDLIQNIDKKTYDDIIDTNLTNPVFSTKYVIDAMIHNKDGIIINISSIWGQVGASNESIYSATKGAIDSFTKSLAKELKYSNIYVVAFSLGMVDTDMNKHLNENEISEILNSLDNHKLLDSKYVAEEIYNNILYRKYCSGSIIEMDNGLKNI